MYAHAHARDFRYTPNMSHPAYNASIRCSFTVHALFIYFIHDSSTIHPRFIHGSFTVHLLFIYCSFSVLQCSIKISALVHRYGRYAINMSHPASQPWLDSVYGQYGEWGIDLIKNDCIFAFNMVEDNIKAVSAAIQKTGKCN